MHECTGKGIAEGGLICTCMHARCLQLAGSSSLGLAWLRAEALDREVWVACAVPASLQASVHAWEAAAVASSGGPCGAQPCIFAALPAKLWLHCGICSSISWVSCIPASELACKQEGVVLVVAFTSTA